MTDQQLLKLIKLAKKQGLKSLSVPGDGGSVSFEFSDKPLPLRTRARKEERNKEPLPEYSEEEVLGWSVSNYGAE